MKSIGEVAKKVLAALEDGQHKFREEMPRKGSKACANNSSKRASPTLRKPDTPKGFNGMDGLRNLNEVRAAF